MLRRVFVDANDGGAASVALHLHVMLAGRHIDVAGLDDSAVGSFNARPSRIALEMLGENGGEGGRHVLRDEHGHVEAGSDHLRDLEKRLGAARGAADGDHAGLFLRHGPEREGSARRARRGLCAKLGRTGLGSPGTARTAARLGDRLHFRGELAAELFDLMSAVQRLRLGDIVRGAERQRLERNLGVAARARGRHDDAHAGRRP